jgi:hypothetical protein
MIIILKWHEIFMTGGLISEISNNINTNICTGRMLSGTYIFPKESKLIRCTQLRFLVNKPPFIYRIHRQNNLVIKTVRKNNKKGHHVIYIFSAFATYKISLP